MSEVLGNGGEINKWQSPEAKAILRLHTAQHIQSGIIRSYMKFFEDPSMLEDPYDDSAEYAGAELPLLVLMEKINDHFSDMLLIRLNPNTGEQLFEEDESTYYDTLVRVTTIDTRNEEFIEPNDKFFSEEQIRLLYQQSKELDDLGLLEGVS